MLHILTVIGARPQIIKAAAISRAIREKFAGKIRESLVHTGQHYDENMSQVFFDEMEIPSPDYNLAIGSGTHGKQTAEMIARLEEVIQKEKPQAVLVYGDTNSTLAGAVAASKMHVPLIHIEAGMRAHNKKMPEEVNRILCDHVSTLLFAPTKNAIYNLQREGISKGAHPEKATIDAPAVYHCGDIMYDNSLHFARIAENKSEILKKTGVVAGKYFLATVHRDFNADDPERLRSILQGLKNIAAAFQFPVVFPVHPRTRQLLASVQIDPSLIKLIPPASFLEMTCLEKNAALVLTDSGGVQKEAFFFKRPCVILREETEWVELVECGAAKLAGVDPHAIQVATQTLLMDKINYPEIFGDGKAANFICKEILHHLG
ncbi:MAG TPA: UDP-N-acetylglucosamine 2-epimerase (non-hydrolyzing) [Bacteroidia bacterium]|nr:UDP-N-acetylglucosamine 2-epimerase (non-hydrolyzing) [Bacteroidia bacterium]